MYFIKSFVISFLRKIGYDLIKFDKNKKDYPVDFSDEDIKILNFIRPFTMTSPERIFSLIRATEYITKYKIEGDIVECGVWKGGSMMTIAKKLKINNNGLRHLYLFDTYEGMPQPKDIDISIFGMNANSEFEKTKDVYTGGSKFCYSPLDEVKQNLLKTEYDTNKVHFIKGKVEDTVPKYAPNTIALLRLDTDWYESTKHELIHLYPRLVKGGILIIDDYGHWDGARKAVEEFFTENNIQILLNRIDYTGRIGIKL